MATNCINLEDIDHNLGCDGGNMAGIVPTVIYGYWEDVDVWPDEPRPAGSGGTLTPLLLEDAGKLSGDLVMKSGTRAFKFDFTEDAGNFTIQPVGEVDGAHFLMTLNIIKAKIREKVLGFQNAASTRKMFFIVQDENEKHYLMGNKKRGCTFVSGGEGAVTGTTSTERNQITMQFTFRDRFALIYTGDTVDLLIGT